MNSKGIVITSYYFPPENTPRSFRTIELAKYFAKNGWKVIVVIPNYDQDYTSLERKHNFTVIQTEGWFSNKFHGNEKAHERKSRILKNQRLKSVLRYFIGSKDIGFYRPLLKTLEKTNNQAELKNFYFLAIGLPISVTMGTAIFMKRHGIMPDKAIAEYGDPYYYNPYINRFFLHKYLEKKVLKRYETITVTTSKITHCFTHYKPVDKVVTIPQGFDLDAIEIPEYKNNSIPTFAYAGSFYDNEWETTDKFMRFLTSIEQDFRFVVYTDVKMKIGDGVKMILPYKDKLGDKLVLRDLIPRSEVIPKLAGMNFLVYIEADVASPSKLIDYTISGRPILLIDEEKKYKALFLKYLNGDYIDNYRNTVDLNKYDINNIGESFKRILEKGDRYNNN